MLGTLAILVAQGVLTPFEDVSARSGVEWCCVCGSAAKDFILEANGSGAALADLDGDGDLDLLLPQGTTIERLRAGEGARPSLYLNDGTGAFADASDAILALRRGWWTGAAAGDFDGDGDVDVYLTAFGPDALLRNEEGALRDVSPEAGVATPGWGTSAAWADVDGDGALDLYVARYLEFDLRAPPKGRIEEVPCVWKGRTVFCGPHGFRATPDVLYRNRGDGTFEDVSDAAGVTAVPAGYGLGVLAGDFDLDGDPDLYVANDSVANFLFVNDGGRFLETGLASGVAYSETGLAQAGMGVASGDVDGDGRPDLAVTNFSDEPTTLYRALPPRDRRSPLFENATYRLRLASPTLAALSWGVVFLDADLDGDLDLFQANGHVYPQADLPDTGSTYAQRNLFFANRAGREAGTRVFSPFVPPEGDPLDAAKGSRGVAAGDLDGDGATDLVVVEMEDVPTILRNAVAPDRPRLVLEVRGRRSARDGIGAIVVLEARGVRQVREVRRNESFQSSSDARLVFGLGEATAADRIEVRWPSGLLQVLEGPFEAGRLLRLVEGSPPAEARALRSSR